MDVEVSYEGAEKVLPLSIGEGTRPNLFGHTDLCIYN